jgi:hypothetical protein
MDDVTGYSIAIKLFLRCTLQRIVPYSLVVISTEQNTYM